MWKNSQNFPKNSLNLKKCGKNWVKFVNSSEFFHKCKVLYERLSEKWFSEDRKWHKAGIRFEDGNDLKLRKGSLEYVETWWKFLKNSGEKLKILKTKIKVLFDPELSESPGMPLKF